VEHQVAETVRFEPAVIDRAIGHLTKVLTMMDQHDAQVGELRQVTQPGAAPSTRAFHGLLAQSMSRLQLRHEALRRRVQNQIDDLKKTKNAYTATDQASASRFIALETQL
jgi:hypothetical protein